MGALKTFISDKLSNFVAGLGTDRDKSSGNGYFLIPIDDGQLQAAYRGSWLPRKIIDIPPLDATRRWRAWQADAAQIEKIEATEKLLGYRQKLRQAMIRGRLMGGAAIYVSNGDKDTSQPLDPKRGIRFMTVMSKRDLKPMAIVMDPANSRFGLPEAYQLTNSLQTVIHPSRLIICPGSPVPDPSLDSVDGWGFDSVLQSVLEAVKQADAGMANVASMIFEAKVDVIKVPDLMSNLQNDKGYAERFHERLRLAAIAKGINGMLVLDAAEEYESKSANFGTLPDLLDRFLQAVAGAADIPATRLLGQSPAGMNATGDSDTRNYYDRIQSMQELEMTPAMELIDEALIYEALGSRPAEIHYVWNSLWQVSATERADNGKTAAETLKTLADSGLFNPDALSQAGANMLVEQSVLPGLEAAIAEFGTLPGDDEVGDPALPTDEDAADA